MCKGRRPHLHDIDPDECEYHMRAILLGASNLWFSYVMNSIALPTATDKLAILVNENWGTLERVSSQAELVVLEKFGQLLAFSEFSAAEVWKAIERKRNTDQQNGGQGADEDATYDRPNLFLPEWTMFTAATPPSSPDFRLRTVPTPNKYRDLISRVVLVERMREVRALVGFTRIDSPGELAESEDEEIEVIVPISRKKPTWIPAIEVRGEGIFLEFNEQELLKWLGKKPVEAWNRTFFEAHKLWRAARHFEKPEANFPGLRYILLHSFSHALMRQFALESGYTQASIRERIYSNNPSQPGGAMAGILLYTSAPDSEGTLGGLVNLGEPKILERHIDTALEACRLCASDPTCAENNPLYGTATVHAAACHACLFAPETSCERGNKYLDRTVLVETVANDWIAFFDRG
jgi:hypothetical protein